MSRVYRIEVSESLRRHLGVEDGLAFHLELLDILPKDEMAELLVERLVQRGFERAEDGTLVRVTPEGIETRVDPTTGGVHVGLVDETDVELTTERSALADEEVAARVEAVLRQDAVTELESRVERATTQLQAEVTGRLEATLSDLRRDLDDAVNDATRDALQIKARQLGTVTSVHHDPETGELTIQVDV